MEDKYTYHMSHTLTDEDRLESGNYRWHLRPDPLQSRRYRCCFRPFQPKLLWDWFGTKEKRQSDVPSLQTPPYGMRENLYQHWLEMFVSLGKTLASSRRLSFYNICNSYRDVLCPTKSEKSSFVDSYLIHLLNHSLKSIDQGFTRPKVLILVPLAKDAHLLVRRLFQLYPSANMGNAEGLEKFNTRIVEHTENDDFIFSIKLQRESIRLYGAFDDSDIMIASPLSLVSRIWLGEKTGRRDDDFLSSIELLVVDYSHRKEFKNLAYVPKIVDYLNSMPAMDDATHIRPVRHWHRDGEARFYRQTIILSYSVNQDIKDLFYRHCVNFEGKMEFSHLFSICRRLPPFPPPLPTGHCIIAMTYPPGNKLLSFVKKSAVQDFSITEDFPRVFAIHGGWEIDESNVKILKAISASQDWTRLLALCMPNVTQAASLKNITEELNNHGKFISFLDGDSYIQFVVGVFLRYKFDQLMIFICGRVRTVLQPRDVTRMRYLGLEWLGISVAHFGDCLQAYYPSHNSDLVMKLFFHDHRFFLYELITYVTNDGKLAQREGKAVRASIFAGKKITQVEAQLNDIVYFLDV